MSMGEEERYRTAVEVCDRFLKKFDGNYTAAAADLGVNSSYFTWLYKHGKLWPKFWEVLVDRFGLDPMLEPKEYEPCPDCGRFHKMRTCTRRRKRGPRQRFMVPLNDVERAVKILEKEYPDFEFSWQRVTSG